MLLDDDVYQAYLEELRALEQFRSANAALYGDTPLESSEDPYTERIVEALALFGARTRLQSTRKMTEMHQVLFRQHFPYLINPLPSMGLLQIKPSLRFPEKTHIKAGTEFKLSTNDDTCAIFQSLEPLDVFPLFSKAFSFEQKPNGSWICSLAYSCPHQTAEEIGSIKWQINYLNSFFPSLRATFALQESLDKVEVFYDDDEQATLCTPSFGSTSSRLVLRHPVEQVRSELHFPQQTLAMTLQLPPCKKRWQSVRFVLHLKESWHQPLQLTEESFIPFVTPIINLKHATADPIIWDGTQEKHPVIHPDPEAKCELHSILQVSEVLDAKHTPLKPGILAARGSAYELDYFSKEVTLDLPVALDTPKVVAIDALWSQPHFSSYISEAISTHFVEDPLLGLSLRLVGVLRPHEKSLTLEDPYALLSILALKSQTQLTLDDVLFLVNALKQMNKSLFHPVIEQIKTLDVVTKQSSVVQYIFNLNEGKRKRHELIFLFFKNIHLFLDAWLSHLDVETKVVIAGSSEPLIFKDHS